MKSGQRNIRHFFFQKKREAGCLEEKSKEFFCAEPVLIHNIPSFDWFESTAGSSMKNGFRPASRTSRADRISLTVSPSHSL
jgi:hypothetical protein